MDDLKTNVGKNTHAFRKYYQETQKELGKIIHLDDSTVSKIENGTNEPDLHTISLLADHFQVPVEELIFNDFSFLKPGGNKKNIGLIRLADIFPIISSDEALNDEQFADIFDYHSKLMSDIKQSSAGNYIVKCVNGYRNIIAFNQPATFMEATGNLLSLRFMIYAILKTFIRIKKGSPADHKLIGKNGILYESEIRQIVESDGNEDIENFIFPEGISAFRQETTEVLRIIKNNSRWAPFAEYFLGLQYIVGLVSNGSSSSSNYETGLKMLYTFKSIDNPYADNLFESVKKNKNQQ